MNKAFENFTWEGLPSKNTPISPENLNRLNNAIDAIDDRVVDLDAGKVNKEDGKGLSTNDYTNEEKEQVQSLLCQKWDSGLWSVQPWLDGESYAKDGYSYAVDYQLEASTTYTISISEDDGQTMYVGNLDMSVSQNGLYQKFTTDENGIVTIWLISGRREQDYYDGVINACIVQGNEATWQGQDVRKISGNWAFRVHEKRNYPYNRFLSLYSPFGKYFFFNTGSYNENPEEGETWSGLTIGNPDMPGATEAGMRLEVPNGGVDFSFLNGMQGGTEVCLDFNMGIWGAATGAKYIFAFNESDIGTQYARFMIEKGAVPLYLTKDGIKVKEDNVATTDASEGNWKTVNLYLLEGRTAELEATVLACEQAITNLELKEIEIQQALTDMDIRINALEG